MPKVAKKLQSRRIWCDVFTLAILFAAIWVPRVSVLNQFVTVDEYKWAIRSANFYFALGERDFANTYQREHPGVTTMWAGTTGLLWLFPGYGDVGTGQISYDGYDSILKAYDHRPIDLLAASRFFMVLGNTIALMLAFLFARRLIGSLPAFVGFLLIALNPFHVAHSHLLHLDGMLSCFMLLSLLAFLSYLSGRRRFDLIVSGIAAGLSWLTKSPGFFLIPVIGLVTFIDLWNSLFVRKDSRLANSVWQCAWPLIVWVAVGVIVFVSLWPAMWTDPSGTFLQIFNSALNYADKGHARPEFFNGVIFSDGRLDISTYYLITYLWRSTPVVLVGLLVTTVAFVARRGPLAQAETRRTIVAFVLFVVAFTISMTLGSKKSDRYLLPVYAPLDLVAATGWVAIANWLKKGFLSILKSHLTVLVLGSTIVLQAINIFQVYPYYLGYYNPLMGGSTKAHEVMAIGWGEGLDQAARYLNEKPDARELQVATWYLPSFSYFFLGKSRDIPSHVSDELLLDLLDSDYAVVYIHQWQRQIPEPLLDLLARKMPEHSIWINGLEYVRIYKLSGSATDLQFRETWLVGESESGWRCPVDSDPLTADDAVRTAISTPAGEMPVWWSPAVVFPPDYERHSLSLPVDFDHHLALLGYELPADRLRPGDVLRLYTFWCVEDSFEPPLALFVHLLDAAGQVRAQHDGLSADPGSMEPGNVFVQLHRFLVPLDALPGEYQLEVGVYRPNIMQRWNIYEGKDAVADRLLLQPVSIKAK